MVAVRDRRPALRLGVGGRGEAGLEPGPYGRTEPVQRHAIHGIPGVRRKCPRLSPLPHRVRRVRRCAGAPARERRDRGRSFPECLRRRGTRSRRRALRHRFARARRLPVRPQRHRRRGGGPDTTGSRAELVARRSAPARGHADRRALSDGGGAGRDARDGRAGAASRRRPLRGRCVPRGEPGDVVDPRARCDHGAREVARRDRAAGERRCAAGLQRREPAELLDGLVGDDHGPDRRDRRRRDDRDPAARMGRARRGPGPLRGDDRTRGLEIRGRRVRARHARCAVAPARRPRARRPRRPHHRGARRRPARGLRVRTARSPICRTESMADDGAHEDEPLEAGDFSAWLAGMQAALRGEGESDVPCGTCTACCTSSQFVHIEPDETDTLAHIPKELLFPAPRAPAGTC